MPRENFGAVLLLPQTFSGLWAPGPGFLVESITMCVKCQLTANTKVFLYILC